MLCCQFSSPQNMKKKKKKKKNPDGDQGLALLQGVEKMHGASLPFQKMHPNGILQRRRCWQSAAKRYHVRPEFKKCRTTVAASEDNRKATIGVAMAVPTTPTCPEATPYSTPPRNKTYHVVVGVRGNVNTQNLSISDLVAYLAKKHRFVRSKCRKVNWQCQKSHMTLA